MPSTESAAAAAARALASASRIDASRSPGHDEQRREALALARAAARCAAHAYLLADEAARESARDSAIAAANIADAIAAERDRWNAAEPAEIDRCRRIAEHAAERATSAAERIGGRVHQVEVLAARARVAAKCAARARSLGAASALARHATVAAQSAESLAGRMAEPATA